MLGEFADRAVAYELRELVDDVRAAQDEADDGVWSEGQIETLGAVRGGRSARLRDLGRLPRGWRQVLALAGLVVLGAGSWALGWALLPERTLEHSSVVETPATSRAVEVDLPAKSVADSLAPVPVPPVTPEAAAMTPQPDPPTRSGRAPRPAAVVLPVYRDLVEVLAPEPALPDPNTLSAEERLKWARKLFEEAREAHERQDYYSSVARFEEAYTFAPDQHIFAFFIGQDAWELRDCARVKKYLTLFLLKMDGFADFRKKAQERRYARGPAAPGTASPGGCRLPVLEA